MTMPKFESVAEVVWYDPALRMTPEPAGKIIDSSMSFIESAAIGTKLYPFDQLTEAYEAGKREQAAELEAARAEIERKMSAGQFVLEQLAAEQAKNVGLREKVQKFIDSLEECTDFEGFTAYIATMDDYHEAVEALSTQSDTSALEAIVKKVGEGMRERCAKEGWLAANGDCEDRVASAIRALPAVTLEDLK